MIRKLIFVSLALGMAIILGACAQTPTGQLADATVASPAASPTPAATNTPETALPTPEPVKTPLQQPTLPPASTAKPPFDLTLILADVASQANTPVEAVTLLSWQPVEWRDACLGVHLPKEGCADVITPGFSLLFQAAGTRYAVHTDQTGANYRLAQDTGKIDQLPALSWTRSGGFAGVCQSLTIYSTGNYSLSDCITLQILSQGVLPEAQLMYLSGLWRQYATFEWNQAIPAGAADMFSDQIKFYGTGSETMTPDEQQKLNDYLAQLVGDLSSSNSAADASSGITGQVLIGPTCGGPVSADPSTECADQPYPTTVQVLDSSGQLITQFTTDAEGRFRIALQPGSYTLHPASTGRLPTASDQDIQVVGGQYLTVTITYDSGMR
jgi:hypothetical protein